MKTVGEDLKALLKRAGLSRNQLAFKARYRAGSGVQRYFEPSYTKPTLPLEFVRRIAPVLVGRGKPPITIEEVYRLAGNDLSPRDDQHVNDSGAEKAHNGEVSGLATGEEPPKMNDPGVPIAVNFIRKLSDEGISRVIEESLNELRQRARPTKARVPHP